MSRRSRRCSGDPDGTGSRARGSAGFSLVELVVATAVLAVAMLIASQILIDAQRLAVEAGYRLNRPETELGLALLQRDVRNARSARGARAADGRLELRGSAELGRGRVVYRQRGENLERLSYDDDGELLERAVTVRGVTSFRWQQLSQRLVEVHLVTTEARGYDAPSGIAIVRVALRNRPSSQW